jgi:hypothetical protein
LLAFVTARWSSPDGGSAGRAGSDDRCGEHRQNSSEIAVPISDVGIAFPGPPLRASALLRSWPRSSGLPSVNSASGLLLSASHAH